MRPVGSKRLPPIVRAGALAACLLATARNVGANDVPRYSLEKKVRFSDLVFLGHVVSIRSEKPNGAGEQFAHVRIDTMLKGAARDYADVLFRGMVAEFDPECCEVGKGYLFLVVKLNDGTFSSVNGPFGVYPLPNPGGPNR
jgi:hypothetical protein